MASPRASVVKAGLRVDRQNVLLVVFGIAERGTFRIPRKRRTESHPTLFVRRYVDQFGVGLGFGVAGNQPERNRGMEGKYRFVTLDGAHAFATQNLRPVGLGSKSDDLAGKMQAEIRCADQNTPVYVADPHVGFATVNTLGRNSAVE